jgi:hypothetical protein
MHRTLKVTASMATGMITVVSVTAKPAVVITGQSAADLPPLDGQPLGQQYAISLAG